jgi:prepilin-type N-terminal cleavage/methylation domain-containing protein
MYNQMLTYGQRSNTAHKLAIIFMTAPTNSSGFTLIEILVSIALLSILSGIGVTIFAVTNNSYARAAKVNLMQAQTSQAMEQFERSVRSASSVTLINDASSPSCPANSSSCVLTLTMPSNSIDYAASKCDTTIYTWTSPVYSGIATNGTLQLSHGGVSCPDTSSHTLFDTDAQSGISIEAIDNVTNVLSVTTYTVGSTPGYKVTMEFNATEGVNIKPGGSLANRANLVINRSVVLRNY